LEVRRLTGPAAEWPALADWASCVGRLGDVKYLYSEEMNNKVTTQWKIQLIVCKRLQGQALVLACFFKKKIHITF
jgi:hypothetical protein